MTAVINNTTGKVFSFGIQVGSILGAGWEVQSVDTTDSTETAEARDSGGDIAATARYGRSQTIEVSVLKASAAPEDLPDTTKNYEVDGEWYEVTNVTVNESNTAFVSATVSLRRFPQNDVPNAAVV